MFMVSRLLCVLVSPLLGLETEGFLPHHGKHASKKHHEPKAKSLASHEKQEYQFVQNASVDKEHSVVEAANVQNPIVQELSEELTQMKHRHAQIGQLHDALKADTALLRETTLLKRSSQSQKGREIAEMQMRKATQLVKGTEEMLRDVRLSAVESSQAMLQEANEVRHAADALSLEATEQLKIFSRGDSRKSVDFSSKDKIKTLGPVSKSAPITMKSLEKDDDLDLEDIEDEN